MTRRILTRAEMLAAPDWAGFRAILAPVERISDHDGRAAFFASHKRSRPRGSQVKYIESEVATLRRLAEAGGSKQSIARALGRSEDSVKSKASALGVSLGRK